MNYGFIPHIPTIEDYIFGEARVSYPITLSTPDWTEYLPVGEVQASIYFDSKACVTFSALNVNEAIFRYYIKNNLLSPANIQWLRDNGYFNEQGDVEFSDRFTAKMSGTTQNGNTGYNVANSIRRHGLVPESKYSYPRTQRTPPFVWEEYYQEVPEELKLLGLEFVRRFNINYEIVYMEKHEDRKEALLHSPIQVFVHAWDKPNDAGVYVATDKTINHAVMNFVPQWPIYDSYVKSALLIEQQITAEKDEFIKNLAPDFNFYPHGYVYAVTEKLNMFKLVKGDSERVFFVGADGKRRHIAFPGTLDEGIKAGLWAIPIEQKTQAELEAIPEGHPIGFIL